MTRFCKYCGKEFEPKKANHVFCSDGCRRDFHKKEAKERVKKYHLEYGFLRQDKFNLKFPCDKYNELDIPIDMCLNCEPKMCKHDLFLKEG